MFKRATTMKSSYHSPGSRTHISLNALTVWAIVGYAFLYGPILVLIIFSFNSSDTITGWQGFSVKWYLKIFHEPTVLLALKNSLLIASMTTLVSVIIGTMAALAMQTYQFRGKKIWQGLVYMNLMIPEVVIGIALLMLFVVLRFRFGMRTIMIAHTVYNISLVIMIVRARLHGFDQVLEEVSLDLGANRYQTFWYITLPLIAPGMMSAALLTFTLSVDNFVVTFFTKGPGVITLPLYIYTRIKRGLTPEINAVSTVLLVFTGILILLLSTFGRRDA